MKKMSVVLGIVGMLLSGMVFGEGTVTVNNGISTYYTDTIDSGAGYSKQYEIGRLGYRDEWSNNGPVIVEIFSVYHNYSSYAKYQVYAGVDHYGIRASIYGADLTEFSGELTGKISVGDPVLSGSSKYIPIFLSQYANTLYRVRVTTTVANVETNVPTAGQIWFNKSSTTVTDLVSGFTVDSVVKKQGSAQIDGSVGIGTAPIAGFKLAVEGKMGAREVIITDTPDWADFVFEPSYKLMPLLDLETFVKANKHLPEIPDAKEVKDKGVSVGEMQTKLLQKVEELTLYMIEMKKENMEMKKEIEELKKKR